MVKLPSGHWRDRPVINGRRMSFTAPTQREVREQIEKYIIEQHDKKSYEDDPTVKEMIANYIESKEGVLSPRTIKNYKQLQDSYYESIESLRLSEIDSQRLQYYVSSISEGKSAKTVRNIFGLLTAALGQVSDRRYNVTLPTYVRPFLPTPDDEQVQLLIDNSTSELLTTAMMLSAFGTMRRGEICAIKYKDIDAKNNVIYVHADMVQNSDNVWIYKSYPKTAKSRRIIQYPDTVLSRISEGSPEEYVIPINPNALYKRFQKVRDKVGMDVNLHSLRRYSASFMHALGIPDKYIMEVGGWSSDRVLKNIYETTFSDRAKEFNNMRSDYINEKFFGHEMATKSRKSSK